MKFNRSFDKLRIRRMQAKPNDFELLLKWLNNSQVQYFLEGKNTHYSLDQIMRKYEPRALDMQRVKPNIIEYQNHPIGYLQYYLLTPEEYIEYQDQEYKADVNSKKEVAYGIDLFIGEINYWDQGLGTQSLKSTCQYLFDVLQAESIYIDPQAWNERAIKCYEKCGFEKIKVLKERELNDGELKDCQILKLKSPKLNRRVNHE